MIFKITKRTAKTEFPNKIEMAKNLITTAKNIATRMVTGGGVVANEIEVEERKSICAKCSFLISAENKCRLCGCNLSVKVRFVASKCPTNNWPDI